MKSPKRKPGTPEAERTAAAWSALVTQDLTSDRRCRVKKGTLNVQDCEEWFWKQVNEPDEGDTPDCVG